MTFKDRTYISSKKMESPHAKRSFFTAAIFCTTLLFHSFSVAEEPIAPTESTHALRLKIKQLEREIDLRTLTKKQRIKKAESNLHKLNNRHSWKKAAIGAVVAAAVTANPVGAVLGGVFGGFIGRSEKYNDIEEKIADMEQDIIVSEADFLTTEEVRLEEFTRINSPLELINSGISKVQSALETEVISIAEPPPPVQATHPAQVIATYQSEGKNNTSPPSQADQHAAKVNQEAGSINSAPTEVCYQGSQGRSRKSMSQCFYMTQ